MTDSEPTEVLKLRSPPDILEAVPYLLGFEPRDSLVVLSLRGKRLRLGLRMRADLVNPGSVEDVARVLAGHLVEDGARAAILVSYAEPLEASPGDSAGRLVAAMQRELRRRGVAIAEALHVAEGRWRSYTCRRDCCPPTGTPLADRVRTPGHVGATAVAAGMAVLPSREAIAATLSPVTGLLETAMCAALVDEEERFLVVSSTLRRRAYVDATMALVREWIGRLGAGATVPTVDAAARMIIGLGDGEVRDRCLPWGTKLTGEPDLGAAAPQLWTVLVRHAVLPEFVAPPATLLAWCAYYLAGDGVLANVALERALVAEPGYPMARYLMQIIQAGISPQHARAMLEPGTIDAASA